MVQIARERIQDLFALAQKESSRPDGGFADRYVALARKVGTRYNVRLPTEFRELYCRGCSAFWVEGRTVRTRLRSGRRVRTCLRCGRGRRTLTRRSLGAGTRNDPAVEAAAREDEALVGPLEEETERRPEPDGAEDE
jgi:ribonuclease P protein subunit RPR2